MTQPKEPTKQEVIVVGARMKAFLEDEIVRGVFEQLEATYLLIAKTSPDTAVRIDALNRACALDDMKAGLRVFADRGTLEQAAAAKAERRLEASH